MISLQTISETIVDKTTAEWEAKHNETAGLLAY